MRVPPARPRREVPPSVTTIALRDYDAPLAHAADERTDLWRTPLASLILAVDLINTDAKERNHS